MVSALFLIAAYASALTAASPVVARHKAVTCAPAETVTVTEITTVTAGADAGTGNQATDAPSPVIITSTAAADATTTEAPAAGGNNGNALAGVLNFNPTTPVPVSRAGGVLQPTAVAESHPFDTTAKRAFTKVSIKAPNGQCMFVNPQAGDFRENLIPIGLTDCSGTPNEQWDVITAGVHNDGKDKGALIVSSLTNGCMSFDGRRTAGDTVTIFSCGGRADGSGKTNSDQLVPFPGTLSADGTKLVFAPIGENGKTCLIAGNAGRIDSAACTNDGTQVFTIGA